MRKHTLADFRNRPDLEVITGFVEPGFRVLDLGCGDGGFLRMLKKEKGADVLGMEIDQELIAECIANGVPVVQSDLDTELEFADDNSFDLVILSQTLQQVKRPDMLLRRIVRVGKRAAISVINFGHLQCRFQLLLTGRMPRNAQLPYHWYNTPNIHHGTIHDFQRLAERLHIRIVRKVPINATIPVLTRMAPNLLAVGCVFLLEKR